METRFSLTNQVLKSIWLIDLSFVLKQKWRHLSSALTFRCGSDGNGTEKDCIWLVFRHSTFLGLPWNIDEMTRKYMFLSFSKTRFCER